MLAKGRVGPLQGFRSKLGRPFEALVKLSAEKKPEFDFGQNGLDAEQKIDTEKHEALGLCPVCKKGQVYVWIVRALAKMPSQCPRHAPFASVKTSCIARFRRNKCRN